ncbi:MAG: hypothetical protein ACR2NM_09420 [Bythopirellula sp.]
MQTGTLQKFERSGSLESLEERLAMSADPISGLLGGEITHHSFAEELPPT